MPLLENDISWQVLRQIVRDWAGAAADLEEVKRLVGGCINTTVALTATTGDRAVLKISPHRVSRDFAREAEQLRLLRGIGLPVPRVYQSHTATLENPHSYLLMEFVEGVDLNTARKQCDPAQYDLLQENLAELVLTLHAQTADKYRRHTPDDTAHFENWPDFYRHVYDPIWRELAKSPSLPPKARKHIGKVHDRLDKLLAHDDRPRLVHWDIWATNILAAADADGRWQITALLDPNCKFAHAEAEIAYMELFQTITPAFLKAYQQHHKLGENYHRVRKPIYQLYPLINHVNLFGSGYLKPLLGAIEKVTPLV